MKKKVLIIEDEEDLIKGLKLNLIDEGYEVDSALNGVEGLRKAIEKTPDLIILDIMLPDKDGLEVCRELRKKILAYRL
jgi:two-component system alkaline phosphatase synthesis response regulator PhoP